MVIIIFLSRNSIKITKLSQDAIGNLTIKGNILQNDLDLFAVKISEFSTH